jgi:hypothetical protein
LLAGVVVEVASGQCIRRLFVSLHRGFARVLTAKHSALNHGQKVQNMEAEYLRNIWNFMEFYGILWNFMDFYGIYFRFFLGIFFGLFALSSTHRALVMVIIYTILPKLCGGYQNPNLGCSTRWVVLNPITNWDLELGRRFSDHL